MIKIYSLSEYITNKLIKYGFTSKENIEREYEHIDTVYTPYKLYTVTLPKYVTIATNKREGITLLNTITRETYNIRRCNYFYATIT